MYFYIELPLQLIAERMPVTDHYRALPTPHDQTAPLLCFKSLLETSPCELTAALAWLQTPSAVPTCEQYGGGLLVPL